MLSKIKRFLLNILKNYVCIIFKFVRRYLDVRMNKSNKILNYLIIFFKKNTLIKHFIFALITLFFLFFLWLKILNLYTLHNDYIQVPDYYNVKIKDIDSITNMNKLKYVIIDSIFDVNRDRGIVVNQDPDPFTNVKKNRKVYLTINSKQVKKIYFPDIYDLSLRQAISKLESVGLEIGRLEYVSDIAKNKVLDFKINGIKIEKGQELYVGTIIDLVVGKGLSKYQVIVPNLIGLNRVEANIVLKSTSLNIGLEIFDLSVEDSTSAIIYKQYPTGDEENKLNIGSSIDLYYNSDLNHH